MANEDSASVLFNAYITKKDVIVSKIGEEKYQANFKALTFLKKKEASEGKFQSIKGEMDERTDALKNVKLDQGFEVECGVKGGKLSGG